ncbi:MAG: hypothetical protein NTW14_07870 [bacterium]|nr:hypothetical protein [bacterium]
MVIRQLKILRALRLKSYLALASLLLVIPALYCLHHVASARDGGMTLHQIHVEQGEMTCDDCHARNAQVQKANCSSCHEAGEVDQRYKTFLAEIESAEANEEQERDLPAFSHDQHPEKVGCQECHQNFQTLGKIPFEVNLSMPICTDCHRSSNGPLECSKCHGPGPITPPLDHLQDWRRVHGAVAQVDPGKCSTCHEESYCQDCHEGSNVTANIHPLNWVQTHSFSAKGQEDDCLVCHQTRDQCVSCHRQRNVQPHPLGSSWADPTTGGDHTTAAGNLESCLDCHDLGSADPVCARPGCHK